MVYGMIFLGLLLLAFAAGMGVYIFIIWRRKDPPPPVPGDGVNAARRKYSTGFADAMAWLENWGWQDVCIHSGDDKRLQGYLFLAKRPTNRTALAIHGYRNGGGFREYLYFAPMYLEQLGMNLLIVDDYAHAKSEGRRIGFGWNDRLDVIRWAGWLTEHFGPTCEILLQGVSMGAGAVMMAAGEDTLPPQVRWLVEDCGFSNAGEEIKYVMRRDMHLPAFPLYHLGSLCNRLFNKYFFGRADAVAAMGRCRVPALFVHGAADDYVPTRMVHPLHEACPTDKELLVVEGAAHAESFLVAPAEYQEAVRRLLEK